MSETKGLVISSHYTDRASDPWAKALNGIVPFDFRHNVTGEWVMEYLRTHDPRFLILQSYHGSSSWLQMYSPSLSVFTQPLQARDVWNLYWREQPNKPKPQIVIVEGCETMQRTGLYGVNWVSAFSRADLSDICIFGLHGIDQKDWDDYTQFYEKAFISALARGWPIENCMNDAGMAATREELYVRVAGNTLLSLPITVPLPPPEPEPEPEPVPPPDDDLKEDIRHELIDIEVAVSNIDDT
ncbi:unnamed protein product, partial [marine sediment metagenome]